MTRESIVEYGGNYELEIVQYTTFYELVISGVDSGPWDCHAIQLEPCQIDDLIEKLKTMRGVK